MKEIKFRTIDNEDNTFFFFDLADAVTGKVNLFPDMDFEQFIGLHDKDKKEWYVGDIGEFDNGDRFIIKMEDYLNVHIQWIGNAECEDQARDLYCIERARCIGNKHQNIELLKECIHE